MAPSRRRRRQKSQDTFGYILVALFITVILAAGFGYFYVIDTKILTDKTTLCPLSGPHAVTVVVIDRTDTLKVLQKERLRKILQEIKGATSKHELIEVYTVGPIIDELRRPVIAICNPGDPQEVNSLYSNPSQARRKWNEDFSKRLDGIVESLLLPMESETSPIMESIQSISVSSFSDPNMKTIPRKLIIASDMLQHSPSNSHYSGVPKFSKFKKNPVYARLIGDLNDVNVRLIYIRRSTKNSIQGKNHIIFWERYFSELGANLNQVSALPEA